MAFKCIVFIILPSPEGYYIMVKLIGRIVLQVVFGGNEACNNFTNPKTESAANAAAIMGNGPENGVIMKSYNIKSQITGRISISKNPITNLLIKRFLLFLFAEKKS